MHWRGLKYLCFLGVLASLLRVAPVSAESPQRIVSLNVCADHLVLGLVARDRLAAVSWLAGDSRYTPVSARAAGLPGLFGRLEDVVRLKPDLVITERYQQARLTAALRRLGVRVETIEQPKSVTQLYDLIGHLAQILDVPEAGEQMVREMQLQMIRARAKVPSQRRALLYLPLGGSTAEGTYGHDLFRRAGLRNVAAEQGLGEFDQLSLEQVVMARPDLLVFLDGAEDWPSRAEALLDHPVILALANQVGQVHVPLSLWLCPGPWSADAVAMLRDGAGQ